MRKMYKNEWLERCIETADCEGEPVKVWGRHEFWPSLIVKELDPVLRKTFLDEQETHERTEGFIVGDWEEDERGCEYILFNDNPDDHPSRTEPNEGSEKESKEGVEYAFKMRLKRLSTLGLMAREMMEKFYLEAAGIREDYKHTDHYERAENLRTFIGSRFNKVKDVVEKVEYQANKDD